MVDRPSKKELILECVPKLGQTGFRLNDLRRLQNLVRLKMGERTPPSLGYIASVLRQTGMSVIYDDPFSDPSIRATYAGRLEGVLRFENLTSAEASLQRLYAIYNEYVASADRTGAELVRRLVARSKYRAENLAGNPRVRSGKRQEKKEIANWFRVWLESPSLFFDWLELRKQTEEFRRLFPGFAESSSDEAEKRPATD